MVRLSALAEKKQVQVFYLPLPQTGSLAYQDEAGRCYIGMDSGPGHPQCEQRVRLAHELGHCLTGSFYSLRTPLNTRQRMENRADRYAVRQLVKPDDLDVAVAEGCTELWQLAERFGVTEAFMKKAVSYYTHGNLSAELYF